jgi:phosphoglycolate phosphatase/AHBA synthesis associated protein
MVLRACALLEVSAAEALVVGDSRFDREAAGAAGTFFAGLGIEGDVRLDRLVDVLRITAAVQWRETCP